MKKFERRNGTVEYFTDNKNEIIELIYGLERIGKGVYGGWNGKFLVDIEMEDAVERVENGKEVMVEDVENRDVVYYYGEKMWNHCEGFRVDLLTEEDRNRADKDGVEYIVS